MKLKRERKNQNPKKIRIIVALSSLAVIALIIFGIVALVSSQSEKNADKPVSTEELMQETWPWDVNGKKPKDYSWEEFTELSGAEQEAFVDSFGSAEKFNKWSEEKQPAETSLEIPWEQGGKQPADYTWKEFSKLNGPQQELFVESFESAEEFEKWEKSVNPDY